MLVVDNVDHDLTAGPCNRITSLLPAVEKEVVILAISQVRPRVSAERASRWQVLIPWGRTRIPYASSHSGGAQ